MLFRQRNDPHWLQRLRIWLWPRRSFWRSTKYFLKRVLRLSAAPRTVAMGVAVGAFTSFTPFLGFHLIISFILAYIFRGNFIAAALGTWVGNPLTFPFIWTATFNLGHFILGQNAPPLHGFPKISGPSDYSFEAISTFFDNLWPLIEPMAIGSIPLGIITAIVTYYLTYQAVQRYQIIRKKKITAAALKSKTIKDASHS